MNYIHLLHLETIGTSFSLEIKSSEEIKKFKKFSDITFCMNFLEKKYFTIADNKPGNFCNDLCETLFLTVFHEITNYFILVLILFLSRGVLMKLSDLLLRLLSYI